MENTSASPKTHLTGATMPGGDAINRTLSHGEVALKRAICNHPGMALGHLRWNRSTNRMFDQTPVNRLNGIKWGRAANHHSGETDTGGVRHLLADITELAELQVRLVAGDAKGLADSMVKPAILGVIGLVIMLGAVPVLLLAVANALVEQFAWSLVMAQLTAAGACARSLQQVCLLWH